MSALLLGSFMSAITSLSLAPALAVLGEAFNIGPSELAWLFSIHVIAGIVALPALAKLSDAYGRRPIYVLGAALFGLGSILAVFAPTYGLLLAARAIQAFGGGAIPAIATAVIGDAMPRGRQGFALALNGTVWSVAGLMGPVVGGVLVQNFGWQWIFAVNIPIVVLVIVLTLATFPAPGARRKVRFDYAGLILLSAAVSGFIYGMSRLDASRPLLGLTELDSGGLLALSVLLLAAWVQVEKRTPDPIVRLGLFRNPQLVRTYLVSAVSGTLFAASVFIPTFAITLLKVDPQTAGFLAAISPLVQLFVTPFAGLALDRVGSKLLLIAGGAVNVIGLLLIALWVTDLVSLIVALLILGLGFSVIMGGATRFIVIRETSRDERSIGAAVMRIVASTGMATGLTAAGVILATQPGSLAAFAPTYIMFALFSAVGLGIAFFMKSRTAELKSGPDEERGK